MAEQTVTGTQKPAGRPAVPPVPVPPVAPVVETARVVAEDAAQATARAGEAVARETEGLVDRTADAASSDPLKGLFAMATSFDPAAFAPNAEKFQSLFGDIQSRAKSGMERGAKAVEEMGEFTRGNVEALVASGRAAAKGAEALGQDAASYGRKSVETASAAFKSFAAAKSPTELLKLQSEFAKSAFEDAVAEGSRFSETVLKLFGEIAQPLSTRVAVAAEKLKTPVA